MKPIAALLLVVSLLGVAFGQQAASDKDKRRAIKDAARQGSGGIVQIRPYLKDPSVDVRHDAVQALIDIGTQHSLDGLIEATRDNDPGVQQLAVAGLVNFYLPGYIKRGFSKVSGAVREQFDRENDDVIAPYVQVRPDVITALGRLARGGSSMTSRAEAARAVGVLRGKGGIPDLVEALRSKDDRLIFESLIALQKIREISAGPSVLFLMRDLDERVRSAAIETAGLLQAREAIPQLQKAYQEPQTTGLRRAIVTALANMPDPSSREIFRSATNDKDEKVRAGGLEGLARLKNPQDQPLAKQLFENDKKIPAKTAAAYALVAMGDRDPALTAPLGYLISGLNVRAVEQASQVYLIDLARDPGVRKALYDRLQNGLRSEKIGIARVLAVSGDEESIKALESLSKDVDTQVAQEGLLALRTLRTRLFDARANKP